MLASGQTPWTAATGLVVRGYVSKSDRSVQPYGLIVPPSYSPEAPHRWRVDAWFHGRNETLSEVNFLWDRLHNRGEFTPPDTIVLHLYGRYCNANKLAGEVDLFEPLEDVKRNYPIDENRILVRGFSMGGAAAWHFGHGSGPAQRQSKVVAEAGQAARVAAEVVGEPPRKRTGSERIFEARAGKQDCP